MRRTGHGGDPCGGVACRDGARSARGALGPEGLEGWFLLEATAERLAVAREREVVREAGDDLLRTHDVVAVSDFGGTGWHLEQWSSCSPQLVHDGIGPAEVWLDGVPDPATPFTLRLSQPVGERTLVDGSVYPARPLDAAPAELQRD